MLHETIVDYFVFFVNYILVMKKEFVL